MGSIKHIGIFILLGYMHAAAGLWGRFTGFWDLDLDFGHAGTYYRAVYSDYTEAEKEIELDTLHFNYRIYGGNHEEGVPETDWELSKVAVYLKFGHTFFDAVSLSYVRKIIFTYYDVGDMTLEQGTGFGIDVRVKPFLPRLHLTYNWLQWDGSSFGAGWEFTKDLYLSCNMKYSSGKYRDYRKATLEFDEWWYYIPYTLGSYEKEYTSVSWDICIRHPFF